MRGMMKFYDLRKRLCEERDVSGLADLHCSAPGEDSVQCTAFTRKTDLPTSSVKLVMPKYDGNLTSYKHSCDSSPTSDFDSDSDSGNYPPPEIVCQL